MINKTGIYKITCLISNKYYYGSAAQSFKIRWNKHKNDLKNKKHDNPHLQHAWDKYGQKNFKFEIVLICSRQDCLYYEQIFLDKYYDKQINCYNICLIAGSHLGVKRSLETREKISKNHADMRGSKNPNFGKDFKNDKHPGFGSHRSEESRKKISLSHMGIRNRVKLTWGAVEEIRAKYKNGTYTYKQLAKEYGVKFPAIHKIIKNITWKLV